MGEQMSNEFDSEYLSLMADEVISLFHGQGETRNARLADAMRRARTLVGGLEKVCGAVKQAAPHIYEDR